MAEHRRSELPVWLIQHCRKVHKHLLLLDQGFAEELAHVKKVLQKSDLGLTRPHREEAHHHIEERKLDGVQLLIVRTFFGVKCNCGLLLERMCKVEKLPGRPHQDGEFLADRNLHERVLLVIRMQLDDDGKEVVTEHIRVCHADLVHFIHSQRQQVHDLIPHDCLRVAPQVQRVWDDQIENHGSFAVPNHLLQDVESLNFVAWSNETLDRSPHNRDEDRQSVQLGGRSSCCCCLLLAFRFFFSRQCCCRYAIS
mmetsp:Transcript_24250/g.39088  ORF Transcript_24250/g.39088 Transcript_24250/m.39088 type:complete len:253 (+) Transcript_24250:359-1117(+)